MMKGRIAPAVILILNLIIQPLIFAVVGKWSAIILYTRFGIRPSPESGEASLVGMFLTGVGVLAVWKKALARGWRGFAILTAVVLTCSVLSTIIRP